jgi:hypothetical protein
MPGNKHPRFDQIQASIQRSQYKANIDLKGRRTALGQMERLAQTRVVFYYSPYRSLLRTDVVPFSQLLKSVGVVSSLDLVIASPGGDGTAAETMVDLCRKYCSGTLRVAVPAYAKSAATLIALSADKILMGESSELGPIDAQISVRQDGVEQQVSADHVIRAFNEATKNLGDPDPAIVQAAQIQLSTLSAPFVHCCRDLMNFAKDFAGKQLRNHMFKAEHIADATKWDGLVDGIVENLMASSRHLLHGRMITAQDIKSDPQLKELKVEDLPPNDSYWLAMSELLLRTDIITQQNEFGKVLFAKGFQMFGN